MESKENDIPPVQGAFFIAHLRNKYAERPWLETQLLVRRCMERLHNPKCNAQFLNCLDKLNEAINVCSVMATISRLETIAKLNGLGFHLSPTESTCYLTADMFYVEVMLSKEEVLDVKLAQLGKAPLSSELLLKLLRAKKFDEFSMKMAGLNSFYNIPGDNEAKIKIYTALQCLEKDLLKISYLGRPLKHSDLHVDTVLNGRVGKLVPFKDGNPMTIEYYLSPYDYLLETSNTGRGSCGHLAFVMAGTCDSAQRLPMSSLISPPPQVDVHGLPVFTPLENENSEVLPACFLLRLQPPLPMSSSFICKIERLTKIPVRDSNLMWLSFLQLLVDTIRNRNGSSGSWETGDFHYVLLPENHVYSYVLSESMVKGALVNSIPFTHPAHVPLLLELLRHQSMMNTLLASCITCYRPHEACESDLCGEVILESDTKLSVHFSLPDNDTLFVLMVNVQDSQQLSCKLFPPYLRNVPGEDHLPRVMKRCMSLPVTMRSLSWKMMKKPTAENAPVAAVSHAVSFITDKIKSPAVVSGDSYFTKTNMSVSPPLVKSEEKLDMETSCTISQNVPML